MNKIISQIKKYFNRKKRRKEIIDYIKNIPLEVLEEQLGILFDQEEKTWLPENQYETLSCCFCLEPSHIVLCSDKVHRPICPDCRELYERIETLYRKKHLFIHKKRKDWTDYIEKARNEIEAKKHNSRTTKCKSC